MTHSKNKLNEPNKFSARKLANCFLDGQKRVDQKIKCIMMCIMRFSSEQLSVCSKRNEFDRTAVQILNKMSNTEIAKGNKFSFARFIVRAAGEKCGLNLNPDALIRRVPQTPLKKRNPIKMSNNLIHGIKREELFVEKKNISPNMITNETIDELSDEIIIVSDDEIINESDDEPINESYKDSHNETYKLRSLMNHALYTSNNF